MYQLKYIPDQIYINGQLFGTFDQFKAFYTGINTAILKRGTYFELTSDSIELINDQGHHVAVDEKFKVKPYRDLYNDVMAYAPRALSEQL